MLPSSSRRSFLQAIGTIPAIGALAGCGSISTSEGTLATHVSDQPGDIGDFDRLLIHISGVRVKPEDAELVHLDADAEVDLTDLTGDASELIDESQLETGSYESLMLAAEATDAVLANGESATIRLPGEAPLKFNEPFEIREDQTTTFIADFTPVKRGKRTEYVLQPVANEVEVIYE